MINRFYKFICSFLVLVFLGCVPTPAKATSHMLINVRATIVEPSCTISISDINQTLTLDEFNAANFKVGGTGPSKQVNIILENCGGVTQVKAAINPDDSYYASDPGVLKLSPTSTANGVGFEILDSDHNPLNFNAVTQITLDVPSGDRSIVLIMFARLKRMSTVVIPGVALSSFSYDLEYL